MAKQQATTSFFDFTTSMKKGIFGAFRRGFFIWSDAYSLAYDTLDGFGALWVDIIS